MEASEEIAALETIAAALEPLDVDARQRILDWIHNRYLKPGYDMLTKDRRDAALGLHDVHSAMYGLTRNLKGITVEDLLRGLNEVKRLSDTQSQREPAAVAEP